VKVPAVEDKLQIVYVPVNQLKPYKGNPRKINEKGIAKLQRSVEEFGFVNPILAQRGTNMIIAGHQRLKAAQAAGLSEVPVVWLDMDDVTAKAYNIADNRLQDESEWDFTPLADMLTELDTGAFDLTLTGFDSDELEQMMNYSGKEPKKSAALEVPEDPVTQYGDIWALGEHRVACGNCTDVALLERLLGGQRVQCIVTSPPYAEQRKKTYGGIPADEYPTWFGGVAAAMREVLDDAGSFFVNIKEHVEDGQRHLYVMQLVIAMVQKYGWRFVDELVWTKTGVPGGWQNRLRNDFEPVFWFTKAAEFDVVVSDVEEGIDDRPLVDDFGRLFHFTKQQKIRWRPKAVGERSDNVRAYARTNESTGASGNISISGRMKQGIARPGNVLRIAPDSESIEHPAMYPVGLPMFVVKLTTEPGDRVFDPFMGAGTTLIAAEKAGRVCFGTELLPGYVDIIVKRWEQLTGKKAELVR
jgi:DNA modification methylase